MATEKPLNELSLEELQAKEKSMKSSVNLWTALLILMALGAIANTIFDGFSTATCMPLIFLVFFTSAHGNWKKVKAEIATRNDLI
ncbi:hypothetical protein [Haliscomenobacter sp.]|uniref:hypothetical protein n=1 Tax=Haliscomenobacter sp. TaxID=2717303 RepID=UPI003BAC9330